MGNDAAKHPNTDYSIAYGDHVIVRTQSGFIVRKFYQIQLAEEKVSFLNLVTALKSISIPTTLQILSIVENEKYLQVDYKYYPTTLQDIINEHITTSLHFKENEIINMIDCVLSGLMAFQFKNAYFGDLRPARVFVTKNSNNETDQQSTIYAIGLPLLMNRSSMREEYSRHPQRALTSQWYYISPEVISNVQNAHNASFSLQRDDIFSLGMIALEMATLQPLHSCYDYQRFKVNANAVSNAIYSCRARYSEKFTQLLNDMVLQNPKKRLNYDSLYRKLDIRCANSQQFVRDSVVQQGRFTFSTPNKEVSDLRFHSGSGKLQGPHENSTNSFTLPPYHSEKKKKIERAVHNLDRQSSAKKILPVQYKLGKVTSFQLLDELYRPPEAIDLWKKFSQKSYLI